jgi:energy-coupling factor transport system ATP-binding protein
LNEQGKTVVVVTHDVEFVAECNPRVVLMKEGRIIADGEARRILPNTTLALEASIVPPQISQIFQGLLFLGLPSDVIDVSEAKKILTDRFRELQS